MTQDYIQNPTIRVSLIIINSQRELLLVKHKKNNKEYWVLPGGHLDFGETVEQCALRELKEEVNLDGEYIKQVFLSESIDPSGRRHILNIYTLVKVSESQELKLDQEDNVLSGVEYISLDKIKSQEVKFYPDVAQEIINNHNNNWAENNIQLVSTPWV